jgi:hypothetical protein
LPFRARLKSGDEKAAISALADKSADFVVKIISTAGINCHVRWDLRKIFLYWIVIEAVGPKPGKPVGNFFAYFQLVTTETASTQEGVGLWPFD